MDLSLSEEQTLLQQSVQRFVQDNCGVERRRNLRDTETGFSADNWAQFAELGWLSLPFAEEDGGFDGSAIDTMVLMEEFGRGLVAEPYLVNVVICGGFLRHAGAEMRSAFLPGLMAGSSQWAFAFTETQSRYDLADVTFGAVRDGDDFILNGQKVAVLNGHIADQLLVVARTSGDRRDNTGISLFVVPASSDGISRRSFPLVDGSKGANLTFDNVRVGADQLVGEIDHALPLIEDIVAEAIVAMGAEALGAMDALLADTVSYTKIREQFGQPISKFQALQHRMADMYLLCENLRSLLYYAAIARAESRPDLLKAACGLKVKIGESGRFVSQQAIQLHGGIGMTDELGISHYFKRLLLLNTLFGDSEHHLQRYGDL
ncbi:MAG: acyl-CoA dehydrogenase family protein [Halioglobus sp.]